VQAEIIINVALFLGLQAAANSVADYDAKDKDKRVFEASRWTKAHFDIILNYVERRGSCYIIASDDYVKGLYFPLLFRLKWEEKSDFYPWVIRCIFWVHQHNNSHFHHEKEKQ